MRANTKLQQGLFGFAGLIIFGSAWAVEPLPTNGVHSYAYTSALPSEYLPDGMVSKSVFVPDSVAYASASNIDQGAAGSGHAWVTTTLGGNHAEAVAQGVLGSAYAVSDWYDQGVITGGSGIGTANFTMQLHGTIGVSGNARGFVYLALYASTVHPTLLDDGVFDGDILEPIWDLNATGSQLLASYQLYQEGGAIHSITVNETIQATLDFAYDAPFYLIGRLFLQANTGGSQWGTSTSGAGLDFLNSAYITGLDLPETAVATFASGTDYNNIPVTTVPEPEAWGLMLVGLGLVGWRARRRG